jgi:hypothetical protein
MNIDSIKLKEECSKFYKLGYKTGYLSVLSFLKIESLDIEEKNIKDLLTKLIEKARDHYNSYPCVNPLE